MTYVISVISQKGGVGKSSISQLIALGYAGSTYRVLLADMDHQQKSSCKWKKKRDENDLPQILTVQDFRSVADVMKLAEKFDLIVFDGAPHATTQTLEMSKVSDLMILPMSASTFDMDPQIEVAYELVKAGIKKERIAMLFNRMGNSEIERVNAYKYIEQTSFVPLPVCLEDKTYYRYAAEGGLAFNKTRSGTTGWNDQPG